MTIAEDRTAGASGPDWLRLAGLTMAVVATSSARPAVSYRALELGAGPTALALITGSFAALSLLLAVRVGGRIDRRGERGVFLWGCTFIVVALVADALATEVFILPLSHALLGLGQVCVGLSSQSLAATGGPGHLRDRRFARNAVAVSIGNLSGPLLGGVVLEAARSAGVNQPTSLVFALGTAFGAIGLLIAWRAAPSIQQEPRNDGSTKVGPPWGMIRYPGMREALGTSIAVVAALDILTAYLPVLGESRGFSPAFVGILLSTRAAAGLGSRIGMERLIRRFTRKKVLGFNVGLAGLALTGLAVIRQPVLLIACAIGIGFGLGVSQPITAAWVSRQAPPGRVGSVLALRLSGNRFGQLVLPTVLGVLAGGSGVAIVFVAAAGGLFAATWLISRIDLDGD